MNKKLTSKTQFLNPTLGQNAPAFAKATSITPESDEVLLKRGTIYAIFEAKGGAGYDTELISKVVHDVLHDSYFQSENISPTQSLEKAISEVKDKIAHFTNETITADTEAPEFSIISGVLWGNVMYVVQYGSAQGYLVRDGEMKPINTISEGGFSAASGVVKDGDVIIFCSHEFGQKYPPNKLLNMAIGEQELLPQEACILLKFIVDTSFSSNEQVDFGLPEASVKKEKSKFAKSLASAFAKLKPTKKPAAVVKQTPEPTTTIMRQETSIAKPTTPIKLRSEKSNLIGTLKQPWFIILIIAMVLGISIFFTLKTRKTEEQNNIAQEPSPEMAQPVVEGVSTQVEEPDEEVFYDLKITDQNANPNAIAVFNTVLAVSDEQSGKIYTSDQTTARFDPETPTYVGVKNLINIKGKLGFTDTTGYKVYDLANQKEVESYTSSELGITSAYLDFVYSISGTQLNRYDKDGNTLTGELWGQSESFAGAKSMAIAYSIYIITADGQIEKYSGGAKEDFVTSGEGATLLDPVQVVADIDFENIYVADKGNQRIVSFDEDGAFVKEYKPKKVGAWSDIKSIGISPDEKTLFVLNGSRVYKLSL